MCNDNNILKLCITLPDVAIGVLIRESSHSKRVPLELVIVNITVLGFLGGTINIRTCV